MPITTYVELISNLPGNLGFYPHESLVIASLVEVTPGRSVLGSVLRTDLGEQGASLRHSLDYDLDGIGELLEAHNVVATVLVAVTE
ncbi:DUF4192 domain-containing protein [Corynebacterium sp. ES2715-CONJ3]|uniref:DUF4192 domain-containing protein n=1 Tax=Corynebacterium sp. ES2715-CONJ3 TaxID=2974028 RepID=UPI00216A5146|nr:DUF4192 domain-containing protein [Corynebacterium sp. ES2715-CONJ3]MCS4491540.1 DUF4192 domain-containing protein [Corynebacterium sp. ES2715-CONJ3]